MKKLLLLLTLVLVGVLVVAPYFVGTEAEQIYTREVARLNQQAVNSGIENIEHDYQRGVFSSQSILTFDVRIEQEKVVVVLQSDISHGPVLFTDQGLSTGLYASRDQLSLQEVPSDVAEFLEQTLGGKLMTASTRVDFQQQLHTLAQIAPFVYYQEGNELDFGGVDMDMMADLTTDSWSGTLSIHPISIKDERDTITLSKASGSFDATMIDPAAALAVGEFSLLFDALDIKTTELNTTLKQISLTANQKLVDGKITLDERIAIGSIEAPMPVTAASYEFKLSNLDPAAIALWSQLASQIDQQLSVNPDEMEAELRTLTSTVFQPGLSLNQELKLDAYGGTLDITADLRYLGLADGLHPMDIQEPLVLLDIVEADLTITADEEAINASPAAGMVTMYVEQGLLVRENGQLVLRGKLQEGEATLNGQPFPLREILQQQMQPAPAVQ
ncbi:YdgA family protein [Aestuariirhabdus sp. Z084]|uniref:DUF945 family protein n=1 Tax=Aestuariirhabdus haliotis TaxID=2918751 RepID=UPI00201B4602|nr:DUF945 family protein [Aestuariirhabdus haliotis]MCL6417518.1 YdgA family protein [Aestuariirhabdus haliotis]MCL6421438.1 YdgA family protein [Aestuariirhabdus haliotis]